MIQKDRQAAQMLLGRELGDGWKVVKKIERLAHDTGGVYSCCYEVENGERRGFLKAFDYSGAEKAGDGYDQVRDILNAYKIEREILEKCTSSNCKNVIRLLDKGGLDVPEADKYPRVEYLILEYAEKGDIRNNLRNKSVGLEWKIRSLHQLANGLRQIHNLQIAHQDMKPSNCVTWGNGITKLTDFGSAIMLNDSNNQLPYHLEKDYAGSWEYAPPELLYGEVSSDNVVRRIGCDLYLLGSMIAFYFTGMSMTSLLKMNLTNNLSWTEPANHGRYPEIKAYLIDAFQKALDDIEKGIEEENIKEKIMLCIKYLCHPDPTQRGHELNRKAVNGLNYNLERFVSMFDYMASELHYEEIRKLKNERESR